MRKQILVVFGAAVLLCAGPALGQLDRITSKEAAAGLKAAQKIRKDPLAAGTSIIRKVFGALR